MLYSFKQKSQDFIVEEILPFKLEGKGDAFFVYFEKRNLNTMDVVNYLCKKFGISRLTLGIAGLKDKDAITRQWISIYKSALKKIGGEKNFLKALSEIVKILKTDWHSKPIGMSDKIDNMFYIRLRALQAISQKTKDTIKKHISQLFEKGFPNFFGNQRFGINYQNVRMGKEIVEGKSQIKEIFEIKFKLQAYASYLFNEYLKERIKEAKSKGNISILSHETGPVFGYDYPFSPLTSWKGKQEYAFMKKYHIGKRFFDTYKKYKIFGIQRPLRVYPKHIKFHFQGDDILLQFSLPGGSYASILIDELLKILQ